MNLIRYSKEEWSELASGAHEACFGPSPVPDRYDYAVMAVEGETPLGYVTCREMGDSTVFWQFGGPFPETKGTLQTWRIYQALARYTKERYSQVTTLISPNNVPMLKMAMKLGFRVMGIQVHGQGTLLQLLLDFSQGVI